MPQNACCQQYFALTFSSAGEHSSLDFQICFSFTGRYCPWGIFVLPLKHWPYHISQMLLADFPNSHFT